MQLFVWPGPVRVYTADPCLLSDPYFPFFVGSGSLCFWGVFFTCTIILANGIKEL